MRQRGAINSLHIHLDADFDISLRRDSIPRLRDQPLAIRYNENAPASSLQVPAHDLGEHKRLAAARWAHEERRSLAGCPACKRAFDCLSLVAAKFHVYLPRNRTPQPYRDSFRDNSGSGGFYTRSHLAGRARFAARVLRSSGKNNRAARHQAPVAATDSQDSHSRRRSALAYLPC